MKNHFKKQIESLTHVIEHLDYKIVNNFIDNCVKIKQQGNKIIATALGKNVPICEKFVGTLNSVGINSNFMHTNSAVHGDLGMIKNGDMLIILSKSGNTEESVYLYYCLKHLKIDIWLLTCNGKSSLGDLINHKIVLKVEHEGDPWNLIPNNSSISFLLFLQSVSMDLIDKLAIQKSILKYNHPGGNIGKLLNTYE